MARRKLSKVQQVNIERTSWTGDELVKADLPEVEYVIPQYLPEGLTILGGRPFVGKSFLSLQQSICVATGGMFLGEHVQSPARALYIAKEDTHWGFKARLNGQGFTKSGGRLEIELGWKRFNEGGMADLEKRLKDSDKEYELLVLDSFYKFLSGKKKERDGEIEPIASKLHSLYKSGLVRAIIILSHTSKVSVYEGNSSEVAISGDTALSGVSDSFMIITQKGNKFFLGGSGRNMAAFDTEIKFDPTTLSWQLFDSKREVKQDSVRAKIMDFARLVNEPFSAGGCSKHLSRDVAYIRRELGILCEQGYLDKVPSASRYAKEQFYILVEDTNESDDSDRFDINDFLSDDEADEE